MARTTKTGAKPSPKPAASQKGAPNTRRHVYMDTEAAKAACGKDKDDIEKKCKSEEGKKDSKDAKSKAKPKSKLGAVTDKITGAVGAMDKGAKSAYGYKSGANNAWLDDHCGGLWVKPHGVNVDKFNKEVATLKDALNKDIETTLKEAGGAIVNKAGDAAVQYGEKAVIREAAGVASLVVPVVGEVVLAGVTVWNVVDGVWTAAKTTVAMAGQAKEAYDKISGLKDQVGKLNDLLNGKASPTEIWADVMTAIAEVNPCLRARKCELVPFKETATAMHQANNGKGCCPGQTGHHVIPDAAAAGCPGYKYEEAPTICLEGADNSHGSHGMAHKALQVLTEEYNGGKGAPPKPISYESMRDKSLKAVAPFTTPQCNQKCLKAQLDSYYGKCDAMTANPGTGGGSSQSSGGNSR